MIVKEAVAATKWCPFARQSGSAGTSNRDASGRPDDGTYCIGSACMAWRRDYQGSDALLEALRWISKNRGDRNVSNHEMMREWEVHNLSSGGESGHCGLAGNT